jgi:hypothetical protein
MLMPSIFNELAGMTWETLSIKLVDFKLLHRY